MTTADDPELPGSAAFGLHRNQRADLEPFARNAVEHRAETTTADILDDPALHRQMDAKPGKISGEHHADIDQPVHDQNPLLYAVTPVAPLRWH